MRTMLAMGSMQSALESHEPHLGYCKARGLQQWIRHDYTDALPSAKLGGPLWKDVAYRAVIDEDTNEALEDTRPAEW
eukprot:8235151-Lingulodinium_polyedra.AAC.1